MLNSKFRASSLKNKSAREVAKNIPRGHVQKNGDNHFHGNIFLLMGGVEVWPQKWGRLDRLWVKFPF